jgi:hypothetical protein
MCFERPDGFTLPPQSVSFLSLPFLPESICIEAALGYIGTRPDLVLSLGAESFVVYCMADGGVRRMISSNRCAAAQGLIRFGSNYPSAYATSHRSARPIESSGSVKPQSDTGHS